MTTRKVEIRYHMTQSILYFNPELAKYNVKILTNLIEDTSMVISVLIKEFKSDTIDYNDHPEWKLFQLCINAFKGLHTIQMKAFNTIKSMCQNATTFPIQPFAENQTLSEISGTISSNIVVICSNFDLCYKICFLGQNEFSHLKRRVVQLSNQITPRMSLFYNDPWSRSP